MGRPRLYHTPEERREAERRWRANASEETRRKRAEYIASPEAQALAKDRYARYRQTDKYREAQRRYRASQKAKETGAQYLAKAKQSQPDRIKARQAIASLVRRGDIVRPTACDRCGMTARVDAHHHRGYEVRFWLDVVWLCRLCHKAAH